MTDGQLMAGKTVLVTGGTHGIGKATAQGCAALGARVGIVGRDRARAEAAAADIAASSGGQAPDIFVADMSSQAEVRRLAAEVLEACPRLDVLVNNVGGVWKTRGVTADGIERTLALNHLAPFLLTLLLLDRLKESAPSRIVTVASRTHTMARLRLDDLQGAERYSGPKAYHQSKLANIAFTYELARRLDGTGVTANALHPGVVRTGLGGDDSPPSFSMFSKLPGTKSPAQGARTPVYLASSPEVEGVTGRYFVGCKPARSSKLSRDADVAARLWEASSALAGLDEAAPAH